ncbi:PEP/pyruvate-binding domain-containing protein [Actinomycetospora chibensis]|uniref:PEP/pyruvate-binding domain-containing protein n=1 Tax=Actinomycetospora chibensis TaxID=663606 RepID=A0ABV9RDW5_9PSEU|nr:PEP/pyruvate-binding domain-containing protein [Actinomycetospora chibensis]MDD7924072.1 PEP/pyruvate-binding domain-containing protein [Actinomycetospora chibensis]
MSDAPLVLPLEDVDPTDPDTLGRVGGKAANLGALVRAGLAVPAGVCLTTAAYRRAVGSALDGLLSGVLGEPDAGALAEKARAAVLAVPIPDEVADAVRATCPDGPVAVRSSATAEDLPDASFAGQQDTFLNVVGDDAVLDAVRRCWASLWTDRAVAYRGAHDIDHAAVALAVVIQSMVDARWAGVLFTADPVTGRRGQAVIDAAPGLGESVVSGSVDPEHLVVDPAGEIVSRRAGAGGTVVRAVAGGGTEAVAHPSGAASLDDADARTLARLGRRVEALFGAPQDIEWALDGEGRAWLTQSRPITTLYPLVPGRPGLRLFLSANVAQGVFRPFTPAGLSAARHLASGVAGLLGAPVDDPEQGPPILSEAGERVFVDLTDVLRSRVGRAGAAGVLGVMEARSAEVIATQLERPELSVTRRSPLPALRRVARIAVRYRIPPAVVAAWIRPARARERAFALVRTAGDALPGRPEAGRVERVERARWMLADRFVRVPPRTAAAPVAGFLALGLAARLLRGRARPGELGTVLRGLPHNVTTEMDLALWDLAVRLRDDPATVAALTATPPAELAGQRSTWPPALATSLVAFLAAHGRRAVAEIDLGLPRWSDDPTHLLGVLANYVRLDDEGRAPDVVFARSAAEAEAMIEALAARAGGLRGRIVAAALHRARDLVGLRELPKYWLVTVLAAARDELAAVGADLASRGRLETGDDVFFLSLSEAREDRDRRELVRERRATYERELRRRHVPRIVLSDGTEPEALGTTDAPADGALTGVPASAGTVTGRVRVITDPQGARLEPGDVLVCPSTDPGWTPLFLTAGGLVMEMGGSNSHGAVVAREYGLPAVVGVRDAVARLTGVAEVRVDGTSGRVEPLAQTTSR